jgi:ABC-type multidrug transport system fused ATPase/permease subunit
VRIILYELKKLFQLKMVCLLFIISFIFYRHFIHFDLEHFPNGRPALDSYHISMEMIEQYGYQMNQEEFEHFKKVYEKERAAADAYLQARQEYVDAGLDTYEKFRTADIEKKQEIRKLTNQIMFVDEVDLFWELQAREHLIEYYEYRNFLYSNMKFGDLPLTAEQKERIKDTIASGNIMSAEVFENYNSLIRHVAILIVISIMFMISPIFLQDRWNHVVFLQYSNKTGRKIFNLKLQTALIAAGFITTVQLGLFFILYRGNKVGMFLNANINSVFTHEVFWFELTFLQYILLTIVSIYILVFTLTIIVAVLSNRAPNYISVVGLQVPLAILLFVVVIDYLVVRITNIRLPIYFLPSAYVLLILIGSFLYFWSVKREKKVDLLH